MCTRQWFVVWCFVIYTAQPIILHKIFHYVICYKYIFWILCHIWYTAVLVWSITHPNYEQQFRNAWVKLLLQCVMPHGTLLHKVCPVQCKIVKFNLIQFIQSTLLLVWHWTCHTQFAIHIKTLKNSVYNPYLDSENSQYINKIQCNIIHSPNININ